MERIGGISAAADVLGVCDPPSTLHRRPREARLEADADRYSFTVMDFHHLPVPAAMTRLRQAHIKIEPTASAYVLAVAQCGHFGSAG